MAALYQCCLIRHSTLRTLLAYERGPVKLSSVMRDSLYHDKLKPILLEPHLLALDRRVKIILKIVYRCVQKNGSFDKVVVDDGF